MLRDQWLPTAVSVTNLILLWWLCLAGGTLYGQGKTPEYRANVTPFFKTLSVEEGLPESSVTCILQDYLGYLWFGTENGLVRYDGYSMRIFQPEEGDSGSICGGEIVDLLEDHDNVLWIATLNGLSKFERSSETFTSFQYDVNIAQTINCNATHCIYEDSNHRLWVGTHEGLNLIDRQTGSVRRFYFRKEGSEWHATSTPGLYNIGINAIIEDPSTGELLIGAEPHGLWTFDVDNGNLSKYKFSSTDYDDSQIGSVQSFCVSQDGSIWMSFQNALSRLQPRTRECRLYLQFPIPNDERATKPREILGRVIQDQSGVIWAAYYSGEKGIFSVDLASGSINQFDPFERSEKNTYESRIYALYEDRSGILWVGTWIFGVKKWDRRRNWFQLVPSAPPRPGEFVKSYSICYDTRGYLWSSTNKGLYRLDLSTGKFRSYLTQEKSITDSPVFVTFLDTDGDLWLGTRNSGFINFSPTQESYRYYFNDSGSVIRKPYVMIQDHEGVFWIGTDEFGLYRYDKVRNVLKHYLNDPTDSLSLSQNQVRSICEDRSGALWIGTNLGGLNRFDRKTETFHRYGFQCVLAIHEDRQGNFWIGDYYTGLSQFDRENRKVIANYSRRNGLLSNAVWGILEDDNNNLWIETDNGLLRFDTGDRSIRRYSEEDGLADNFLTPFGKCRGRDGTVYLTSSKGTVAFHPDSVRDDPVFPSVVITRVSLYDRPNEKLRYQGFISAIKEITLAYDENNLRIEYVGLHFSEPGKIAYRYVLQNFDKDWVDAGNQRRVLYTNLEAGRYVFRVKAANRDGIWNEEGASLTIIITPPWWRMWWAYLLYLFAGLAAMYLTWMMQLRRVRTKHAFEMTRFEAQKLQEVDEMKSRFFTNISHEFRTPLTLILGPAKQIAESTEEEETREKVGMIHRNARRLLTLVNQLLDISKLESGSMRLRASSQDIVPLLKSIVVSFTPLAERKRITLRLCAVENEIVLYFDQEKIESIITNVLSNAFKFTPEGGLIELSVAADEQNVSIRTSDTGIGIPTQKLGRVFDRFYQVDETHTRTQEGTGIGLALIKELVELHRGTILVESEEGKGTILTIKLPSGKEHLKPEEIIEHSGVRETNLTASKTVEFENIEQRVVTADELPQNGHPTVLLVEDNADVRHYVSGNLAKDYRVLEAIDGNDGWGKAIEDLPDIIVSDVMMPKMDGLGLCARLKTDERTSHIPVVLLTAKAASRDRIEGFETGADEYITKPFEPEELRARIRNLIEQRKRLHEHFRRNGIVGFDDSKLLSIDKQFLRKIFHIITENIASLSFSVESLAEMAAVSRSLLHKKVVSLTGESPVELIRRMRLTSAAELITKNAGNVSEIALEVGFANPSYFSECFKKQFGVSPSQYAHNSSHL